MPGNLPTTHPDPFGPLPTIRVGGKHEKIRANTATGLQFRRLPVPPGDRSGSTHSGPVDNPPREVEVHKKTEELYCQTVHVSDRTAYSNGKASMVWLTSHEAHPMALEATLACPRSFGESYSGSSISSPPSRLVVGREQSAEGPTPAPPSTRSSAVYRRLKRRLGRTLRGLHCKRRLVTPRKSPPHKLPRVEGVLLALKSFEHLCRDQIVLVATDNTTVISYINKQGGMRSGSLCALLWRLLSWCHPRGISLRGRHIPGQLNVIADKLSRHNQLIQTEWSLSQQVFNLLCSRWFRPQVDLFATRFNPKLPKFVSPVPDPAAWAVDAMSLSWETLDAYAFPPVSLLNQVISKVVDQGCRRMILIAPGWPNIPWFWDLVNLSVQIPFRLPLQ